MLMYVYICLCICTYVYVHVYMYLHMYLSTCLYVCNHPSLISGTKVIAVQNMLLSISNMCIYYFLTMKDTLCLVLVKLACSFFVLSTMTKSCYSVQVTQDWDQRLQLTQAAWNKTCSLGESACLDADGLSIRGTDQ